VSGRVIVQSYLPDHYAIRAAAGHDYDAFYRAEIVARFEVGYPPAARLASCLFTGRDEARVERAAVGLAEAIARLSRERDLEGRLSVVGPSQAPLARLRKSFRWHLLLKSTSPSLLESVLHHMARGWRPPRGVQLAVDRDPYNLV
jgi:primosomal protein N' (replication factor Y)